MSKPRLGGDRQNPWIWSKPRDRGLKRPRIECNIEAQHGSREQNRKQGNRARTKRAIKHGARRTRQKGMAEHEEHQRDHRIGMIGPPLSLQKKYGREAQRSRRSEEHTSE